MNLDPNSALVVFSGGQDSTTCLGWALANYMHVECITFNYNQRHNIELKAAADVVGFFKYRTGKHIQHHLVRVDPDCLASSSPLTDPMAELETYENHDSMEAIIGDRVEKTFVPMRNAVFLMMAANRAVASGCGNLVTGVCEADNANYPDCRQSFINAAQMTIVQALGLERFSQFNIETPLMNRTKAQSVKLAMSLPHTYEALAYSHTAYDGKYPPTGRDHASILRAHGFEQAGVPDPLVIRAWQQGLMALPETANYDEFRAVQPPYVGS